MMFNALYVIGYLIANGRISLADRSDAVIFIYHFTISYGQSIIPPNSFTFEYPSSISASAAVLLVIFGIVKFVEYLINEVAMGYLKLGQSVIFFVFEAVAVVLISKALKRCMERRIG